MDVVNKATKEIRSYDVGEAGSAAELLQDLAKVWGQGTLCKPSGKVFTRHTPEPYPSGSYTYTPAASAGQLC